MSETEKVAQIIEAVTGMRPGRSEVPGYLYVTGRYSSGEVFSRQITVRHDGVILMNGYFPTGLYGELRRAGFEPRP